MRSPSGPCFLNRHNTSSDITQLRYWPCESDHSSISLGRYKFRKCQQLDNNTSARLSYTGTCNHQGSSAF